MSSNIEYLKQYEAAEIYVKRDDRLPFSYGGNKVRIAAELIADMKKRGFTSIVSYGSPGSNMNRAIAHMSMAEKIPCRVIIKKEKKKMSYKPLNERLVLSSGALVGYGSSVRGGEKARTQALLYLRKQSGAGKSHGAYDGFI